MRQKAGGYDPKRDSPLIGGYGNNDKIMGVYLSKGEVQAWTKASEERGFGMTKAVQLVELIGLLEQAAEEFPTPVEEVTGHSGLERHHTYYPLALIEEWKKKWLTVPPV